MLENYSSHAAFDQKLRLFKAIKIEQLLAPVITIKNSDILDIGTGSGYIAHYFSTIIKPDGNLISLDVSDQRKIKSGYTFQEYSGQSLPFEKDSFDIVITNHVIEHVGDRNAQKKHLEEIYRVLKPKGIVYIAVPNKWAIMEPHFKLPCLSWFSNNMASKYVRLAKKGSHYDCYPPSHKDLLDLVESSSFHSIQKTFDALKLIPEIENKKGIFLILKYLPNLCVKMFYPLIPTMIFLLYK